MKWGHAYDIGGSEKLLYTVLSWIIAQSSPVDKLLNEILASDGGIGGDPGWEIEHIHSSDGTASFQVWADPNISGIEPSVAIYSADNVRRALRESLVAFGEADPTRTSEVKSAIRRYHL